MVIDPPDNGAWQPQSMFVSQTLLAGGSVSEIVRFEGRGKYPDCRLCACYRDQVIEVSATDFFEALCRIREALAREGVHPLCYGASLDVYPVGSMRKQTNGVLAYHLTMGRAVTPFDLVSVFDSLAMVIPATVTEQHDYYSQWLQSVP
ncbi:hypothetical protein [Cupriavidus necator]